MEKAFRIIADMRFMFPLFAVLFAALTSPISAQDRTGRPSLIAGQSVNMAWTGASFFMGLGNDDTISFAGPAAGALGGGTMGAYYSSVLTRDRAGGVTMSQSMFINSVSFWSAANGYLAGASLSNGRRGLLISSLADGVMTLGAVQAAYTWDMKTNSIALVNSGGMWGSIFSLEIYLYIHDFRTEKSLVNYLLIGNLLGLAATGLWSGNDSYTTTEINRYNLYAGLGALIGMSITTLPLICDHSYREETLLLGAFAGSLAAIIYYYGMKGGHAGSGEMHAPLRIKPETVHYFMIPVSAQW